MRRRAMLRSAITWPFLVAGMTAGAARVHAHKLQYTLTDMQWKPDGGGFEVIHSIHLDDAMALLAQLGDPAGEMSPASQARLLHYTQQHFQLHLDGAVLLLEAVGAQIDGDYLWIYQEQILDAYPEGLSVECTLMHEMSLAQQNQVNLRVGDEVKTLRFQVGSGLQTFG